MRLCSRSLAHLCADWIFFKVFPVFPAKQGSAGLAGSKRETGKFRVKGVEVVGGIERQKKREMEKQRKQTIYVICKSPEAERASDQRVHLHKSILPMRPTDKATVPLSLKQARAHANNVM